MFPFIEAEKAEQHNVARACQLLEVSRFAFYDHMENTPSARVLADAELAERVQAIYDDSRGTYGWPRVHRAVRGEACPRLPQAGGPDHAPAGPDRALPAAHIRLYADAFIDSMSLGGHRQVRRWPHGGY